jgi:hypothetical protein
MAEEFTDLMKDKCCSSWKTGGAAELMCERAVPTMRQYNVSIPYRNAIRDVAADPADADDEDEAVAGRSFWRLSAATNSAAISAVAHSTSAREALWSHNSLAVSHRSARDASTFRTSFFNIDKSLPPSSKAISSRRSACCCS